MSIASIHSNYSPDSPINRSFDRAKEKKEILTKELGK